MTRILLPAAVAVALLLGACGEADPGTDADPADTTAPTGAGPSEAACPEETEATADASLETALDAPAEVARGAPVTWQVEVTNTGDAEALLVWPSGQDAEVVLEDDTGAEVYRWSDGRFFTAALRCLRLDPGAGVALALEEDSLDVPPGEYRVVATVPADPAAPRATATLTVTP